MIQLRIGSIQVNSKPTEWHAQYEPAALEETAIVGWGDSEAAAREDLRKQILTAIEELERAASEALTAPALL